MVPPKISISDYMGIIKGRDEKGDEKGDVM
jgi:hypothetical protein